MKISKPPALAAALIVGAAATMACAGHALATTTTALTVVVAGGGSELNASAPQAELADTDTGVDFVCPTAGSLAGSTLTASIENDVYPDATPPVSVGSLTGLEFNNCTSPLGPVTITSVSEPQVEVTQATSDYETPLVLDTVDLQVQTMSDAASCSFTVSGDASGNYDNSSGTLSMGQKPPRIPESPLATANSLKISQAKDCAGAVSNGQEVEYTGAYAFSPPTLMITASEAS
jgi:hypothetical protein